MRRAASRQRRDRQGHGWLDWFGAGASALVVRNYIGQKGPVRAAMFTAGVQSGGSLIDAMLLRMVAVSGFTPLALPWLGLWAVHAGFQRLVVQPRFRDQVGRIGDRGTLQLWKDTAKAAQRRRPPKDGPSTDAIFDDVEQVSTGWQLYVPWLAIDSLTIAGAVAGSVILGGPILGLAMGATAAIIAIQGRRSMKKVTAVDERQHNATVSLRRRFREMASEHGWDLFRRMGAGDLGRSRVGDAAKVEADSAYAARKPRLRAGLWTAATEVLFTAGTLAWAVLSGNPLLALGPMILAVQAFSAAVRIPQNLMGVKPSIAASERLSKFMRKPAQVVERVNALDLPHRLQRGVELDHVTFGYGSGEPVLQDVSLKLAPGTVTALIGLNAAGKSTLIDVIQRKFDVRHGSIRFDGVDVRDARIDAVDRMFGASVPQRDYVLNGTLRENLLLADPKATDAMLKAACRKTGLDAWMLSGPGAQQGFDVAVSLESLSGGTLQRLALTRLLLNIPAFVYLDEPTSALDAASKGKVLDVVLRELREAGSVVMLVSHEKEIVRRADHIAVLDQGHVVENGRAVELMGRDSELNRQMGLDPLDQPEYDPALEREVNQLQAEQERSSDLSLSR